MNPQHYATYNPQQQQQQLYAGAGAYSTQSGGMSAPSLHTWVPPSPQEQQYYDMLFAHVDDQRRNAINGQQAVAFFARSHVDKTILREVWSIADAQRRSELSRNEFYVAMRLISMAQRGEQVSVQRFFQMATMQYPLPAMDGVPPPQQQPIQPQAQMHALQQDFGSVHQQATGSQPTEPYALTTDEKSKYSIVFQQYDTDHDGFLMGPEAVALFQMSGLDRNVLRDIWSMADVTQDSKLSVQEFYVAMHLIVCVSKRGLPMPSTLPRELGETAFGSSAAVPGHSSQMSAPSSQNGFPVQTQHESVPPPKPEGMSAFDSFATVEDTPLPTIASSTPRSNSFNHVDSNTTNSLTGGFSEPSVPTPTGGLQGFPAPASQDFGSFSATPAASVTSGRDRTNSASSMNSMSSFSGMAPLPPQPPAQQLPPRNFGSHERIQAQNSGFQAPQQTYPGFGAESFGSSTAAPEKPFMSDEEEKKVVGQLDQQNQQVIQALASVERKQTAIEMISEKLRDLDELRHELVTLVMKREDLRSASNSTFAAGDNAAEEHTRLAVEHSLWSLVENQKQLIQQLQCDVTRHEGELEEAMLSAKLQQKLSLESRSSLIDAASPPVSTHDSDRAGGSKTFVPAPLSLDGSNALPSPVAAPSAPSVSAYSPDATDSSGFNAFSNFDSAPRSIASVTPSSTAGVPSGSPFSPTPSPSQNATASDSFTGFENFVAPPSVDATSPLAVTDVPGRSPFSPAPSPAAASDSAGFDAFGSAPVSADGPAPLSSPAPVEASPFSPFSPSPSPAATDDIGFNGFGDFNAAPSSIPAATEAPGHSPFSPMASPAADTSVSTDFSASFDTPAKIDAPEGSPFSPSPSPAAAEAPAFDAFAAAPLSNDSAATPASTTVATENLIFSLVAANNSGSNTFGDFGAASHDAASSETTVKQESTGNFLFSPTPSPAAASTSSGLDAFGDFSAPPASTDSTASVLAPEKTMGNSPFSPVASDNNDFNGFGDFSAPPAHSATSSAPDKLTEASGSSPFSPVDKDNAGSGFEVFGDLNAAPASTDSAATPSDAPNSANVSGGSPFSPVANDNTGLGDFGGFNSAPAPTESTPETKSAEVSGHSPFSPVATDSEFGDFGDFNSAPVSADSAKPTATKESADSNGFEAFEDFSAAPSSASADFGSFS